MSVLKMFKGFRELSDRIGELESRQCNSCIDLRKQREVILQEHSQCVSPEQLAREHAELKEKHHDLLEEHDQCVRFDGQTVREIIRQRNELLSKVVPK